MTNLRVCRGNSDFDIRHLINANFIYELPFGRGQTFLKDSSGWVNQIIGGWEVSGIATARTGLPFSTTTTAFPVGFNFNSPAAQNLRNIPALRESIHAGCFAILPLAVDTPKTKDQSTKLKAQPFPWTELRAIEACPKGLVCGFLL